MQTKLKAFSIHLSISALIALCVVALVFFIWYPAPLHTAVGVTGVFLILLAVDVVLGPLLTLLVYKPGKKTLVMDLTVIALLQLSALGYGLYTVAEGRPAWLVFGGQHFELVRKVDIEPHHLVREPSLWGPEWVSIQPPLQLDFSIPFSSNKSINQNLYRQPANYQDLSKQIDRIRRTSLPIDMLKEKNSLEQINIVKKKWPDADGWIALNSTAKNMIVLVNRKSGEIIAVADLRS